MVKRIRLIISSASVDIICLEGLPGVGKQTTARALAERLAHGLLHSHIIIDPVCALFPFTSSQAARAKAICLKSYIRLLRERERGTVLTNGLDRFWNPSFRAVVAKHCKATGDKSYFVALTCDSVEHAIRLSAPERKVMGKIVGARQLAALIRANEFYDPMSDHYDIRIDTTRLQVNEVVDYIVQGWSSAAG